MTESPSITTNIISIQRLTGHTGFWEMPGGQSAKKHINEQWTELIHR
jgi:hypothetical protein